MRKWLWRSLGILFVALAYIGIITPGVPTTIFAILAAWAFSKSSPKLNNWLHNHKILGKYLSNWENKRIFPSKGRIAMCLVMLISMMVAMSKNTIPLPSMQFNYFQKLQGTFCANFLANSAFCICLKQTIN